MRMATILAMSRRPAFEVIFDVLALDRDQRQVVVLAIARKVRNKLFVGMEKFEP